VNKTRHKKPLVLIGGGGHASVVTDILLGQGRNIIAMFTPTPPKKKQLFNEITCYSQDDHLLQFNANEIFLINGIGMLPHSKKRQEVFLRLKSWGFHFESVISPNADVSSFSELGEGVQIFSQSVVQASTKVGDDSIINTGAIVEHDCTIGNYNHLAPSSTLCGHVTTGSNVFVGAGATVLPNINISSSAVIGAGEVLKH
jgi:sugar O-acyltransferase (sialic acid O-acetyltransferase NeuD family)